MWNFEGNSCSRKRETQQQSYGWQTTTNASSGTSQTSNIGWNLPSPLPSTPKYPVDDPFKHVEDETVTKEQVFTCKQVPNNFGLVYFVSN